MKIRTILCIISATFLLTGCSAGHFDIVIKNGTVYDGTGSLPVQAEIGIREGKIERIGKNLSSKDATIIDARDLMVAPGFIDIHTHCDESILDKGMNSLKNYLTQGVTTVVTGNCGSGTYKVDEFYRQLDSMGTGTNIVHLIGHNIIRKKVMGMDDRKPSAQELDEMKKLIIEGMKGGAAGISTGLFYTPGFYSSQSELVELAMVVDEFGGFYATHLRDESNYSVGLEASVREAIAIGEQTGIRVEISHIKALGKPVWGMSGKICTMIEEARNKGVNISADQYPYNASSTSLAPVVIPGWVSEGGKMKSRLTDPQLLPGIKKEIDENIDRRGGPQSLVIVIYPDDHRFDGKNLLEISNIIDKSIVETAIFLLLHGNPDIVSFNMDDMDVVNFMKKDYVMTGSDGHIEVPGQNIPHPRCYGTFARKIRKYVIDENVITMEEAIRKATSMPAEMIGLKDRGILKEGFVADIVIFNPKTIRDLATFKEPHKYSSGFEWVILNGDIVIDNDNYNGKLCGKPIRLKQ